MGTIWNELTEADEQQVETYLRENGYADLAEWGRDSDYLLIEAPEPMGDVWVDLDDNPVDLATQCFLAIEAAGEAQDERRYG